MQNTKACQPSNTNGQQAFFANQVSKTGVYHIPAGLSIADSVKCFYMFKKLAGEE